MTDLAIDYSAAAAELDRILSDPTAMAGKLQELAEAARAEFAGREARLDAKLDRYLETSAARSAEFDAREHDLRNREAAVSERERQVAAETQRVADRERAVEFRAADLRNRYAAA